MSSSPFLDLVLARFDDALLFFLFAPELLSAVLPDHVLHVMRRRNTGVAAHIFPDHNTCFQMCLTHPS